MVGWITYQTGRSQKPEPCQVSGLPLLRAALPPCPSPRRLRKTGRQLAREGVRRLLLPDGCPEEPMWQSLGFSPVTPLPLCRALAPRLALTLLADRPPRQRVLVLRGTDGSEPDLVRTALALCPRIGLLILDLDRGFAPLADHLRQRFGAPVLRCGQGADPQVTVEFAPGPVTAGQTLRLWGSPGLCGLSLCPEKPLPVPPELPALPLLELLWETGRLAPDTLRICLGSLSRSCENSANLDTPKA